jgi:hypothetical protein
MATFSVQPGLQSLVCLTVVLPPSEDSTDELHGGVTYSDFKQKRRIG